jgi:probable rRNA maturation factor
MSAGFSLHNTSKGKLPRLPFELMKEAVLGKDYELSLVFLNEKDMHEINKNYHKKDKPTNILSFPLDEKTGEIFICPQYAMKEAHLYDRMYENYIGFLFIHGLVHLKGYDHGSRMENEEQKVREKFDI